MERRKFTMGLGTLAAGAAATMGTGAFSFAQTDRGIDLDVVADNQAYLQFYAGNENPQYADTSSDQIKFEFDGDDNTSGQGINPESVYLFDDVARVANQASQEVALSVPDTANNGFWSTNFVVYVGDGTGSSKGTRASIWPKDGNTDAFDDLLNDRSGIGSLSDLIDTGPDSVTLGVGDHESLGFAFAAPSDGSTPSKSTGITLRAEET